MNVQSKDKNYLENVTIKVVFDDSYEYAGWYYQRNYDNESASGDYYCVVPLDNKNQNIRWGINPADQFAIKSMYEGHYLFGCTLT